MSTTKELRKNELSDKSVSKILKNDEMRELLPKIARATRDPDNLLKELAVAFQKFKDGDRKKNKKLGDDLRSKANEAYMILGLDTHVALLQATHKEYQTLAVELARRLTKEYECKDTVDKMLVEIVVSAFIEILSVSAQYNNCYAAGEYLSTERTSQLKMLSKELDRAHRHFITVLSTLKQMKSPSIEFNIKAKTAFLAQNQQINANDNPIKQNENINPK